MPRDAERASRFGDGSTCDAVRGSQTAGRRVRHVTECYATTRRGGAGALAKNGNLDAAKAMLATVTERFPLEPFAWQQRAWWLATTEDVGLSDSDREQAINCARQAVALSNEDSPIMLATLAEAQFPRGQRDAAIRTAEVTRALDRPRRRVADRGGVRRTATALPATSGSDVSLRPAPRSRDAPHPLLGRAPLGAVLALDP